MVFINKVKSKTVVIGSIIFSIWHVIDIVLDFLYISETPMETDYYYWLLIIFMILPVLFIFVIVVKLTRKYNKGILGFIMFTIGGLTNSIGVILEYYYHIEDEYHRNLFIYNLGLVYMLFEDLP